MCRQWEVEEDYYRIVYECGWSVWSMYDSPENKAPHIYSMTILKEPQATNGAFCRVCLVLLNTKMTGGILHFHHKCASYACAFTCLLFHNILWDFSLFLRFLDLLESSGFSDSKD